MTKAIVSESINKLLISDLKVDNELGLLLLMPQFDNNIDNYYHFLRYTQDIYRNLWYTINFKTFWQENSNL